MIDIIIRLHDRGERWLIEVVSSDGYHEAVIDALPDAIPDTVGELVDAARSWRALPSYFAPSRGAPQPGLRDLKQLGGHLRRKLMADSGFVEHLAQLRAKHPEHRLLFTVGCSDGRLRHLPLELLFDDQMHQFMSLDVPQLVLARSVVNTENRALTLPDQARILVATAHSDNEPRPTAQELADHAAALVRIVRGLGWQATVLPEATLEQLREQILRGVDLLYIACHGQADEVHAGILHLRDGTLHGDTLGAWIDKANVHRSMTAAVLCACSTAEPGGDRDTHGMAEYLVRKVVATVGFGAPVSVGWALNFMVRMFTEIGKGHRFDAAFCEARRGSVRNDPQWALPLLYTRVMPQWGLDVVSRSSTPSLVVESSFQSKLPQRPRPYFTGRKDILDQLLPLLDHPSTAVVVAVEGEGGMGKTEVARWVAHTANERGMPVVWLEKPDREPSIGLEQMIQCVEPEFTLSREAALRDGPIDALTQRMRAALGERKGLVVLDDLASGRGLDSLRPSASWSVIATTRVDGLHAAAKQIRLDRMERAESIKLLGRIRYGFTAAIPEGAGAVLDLLADLLEDLPLALELAGETMRDERLMPGAYLADVQERIGRAGADHARVTEVLSRSLRDQPEGAQRAFLLLGAFPSPGARAQDVALALDEPEPGATRWLDLLTRVRLANYDVESGLYWLHPRMHDEAWRRLDQEPKGAVLGESAAMVMITRAKEIGEEMRRSVDQALVRWRFLEPQLSAIDPMRWAGRLGQRQIAYVVGLIDQFIAMQHNLKDRETRLASAIVLAMHSDEMIAERAFLLKCRGDLRARTARLQEAEDDYEAAISLYRNRPGEANALKARGDLRLRTDRLQKAEEDFNAAISLFHADEDRLGEANALKARGEIRLETDKPQEAEKDFNAAISLHRDIEDRMGEANALRARSVLRLQTGMQQEAEDDCDAAIALYCAVGDRLGEANVHLVKGQLEFIREKWPKALTQYLLAREIYVLIDEPVGLSNVDTELARTYSELGDPDAAVKAAAQALQRGIQAQNFYARDMSIAILKHHVDAIPDELRGALAQFLSPG